MRANGLQRLPLAALVAMATQLPSSSANAGISGVWEGQYVCAQGETGLTLYVSQQPSGAVRSLFFFYPTSENLNVPEGCFEMSGSYDAVAGDLKLAAGRWLLQPEGYVTVDLSAAVDEKATEMDGTVAGPGCTEFRLLRTDTATRSLPAACGPRDLVASFGR